MKQFLYYFNCHGSDMPPSMIKVYFNRIFKQQHVPGLKMWALELHFKNVQIGFTNFFKPYAYPYHSSKFNIWKTGSLEGITLRIGKPIISIALTKRNYERQIENIERNVLPLDFYYISKRIKDDEATYFLHFNYYFDKAGNPVKLDSERKSVKEYDELPSTEEIYREIMLNDWSRWNTKLNEGDKIEISEYVYNYLLDVLPPRNLNGNYFEVGEPDHHDEKGRAIHQACNYVGGKYYTGHPQTIFHLTPEKIIVFGPVRE